LKHRGTESTEIGENAEIAEIGESGELVGEGGRVGWRCFRSEGCGFNYRNGEVVRVIVGPLVAAGRGTGIEKGLKMDFLRFFLG
jgi:hypothetical protein